MDNIKLNKLLVEVLIVFYDDVNKAQIQPSILIPEDEIFINNLTKRRVRH
ncbi:hypothetical protein [Lysinibacillus sphaericus]|nr:hypothetical protein [Lysinibacillus sphaericus]